jgi:hypothetical protein
MKQTQKKRLFQKKKSEQVVDNTQQPGAQEDAPVDTNASVLPDTQQQEVDGVVQAGIDDPSLFI